MPAPNGSDPITSTQPIAGEGGTDRAAEDRASMADAIHSDDGHVEQLVVDSFRFESTTADGRRIVQSISLTTDSTDATDERSSSSMERSCAAFL